MGGGEMSKHTPGPWIASEEQSNAHTGRDDWCIGVPGGLADEVAVCSKRDASLITAAPELLQVAVELSNIVREMCYVMLVPEPSASLERSYAAIAKAKGEPHA
jgi:hypothetical protein